MFEKQTSGIKTYNGMTLDSIEYKNNAILLVGNYYNRVRNSYIIPANIYTWSTEQRFSLCGEIETNKVIQLRFIKALSNLMIGEVNALGNCKVYAQNSSSMCSFYVKQTFKWKCKKIEVVNQTNEGTSISMYFFNFPTSGFHML